MYRLKSRLHKAKERIIKLNLMPKEITQNGAQKIKT